MPARRSTSAKERIESALATRRDALKRAQLEAQLAAEALDVTLPGRGLRVRRSASGHASAWTRIEQLFRSIGFEVADGPEIETDLHNFTALNTPENHPARSMHDTFYSWRGWQVRTMCCCARIPARCRFAHMQAHVARYAGISTTMPDIRIICPGRVYRVDSDATHSPMFHQVEGLWIGESVSFADLKGGDRRLPASLLRVRRPAGALSSVVLSVHRTRAPKSTSHS